MRKKFHVGFVNTHPIQYFAPLYRALNASEEFRITAFYMSDFSLRGGTDSGFQRKVAWDVDLLSGYEAKFLGGADTRDRIDSFFSCWAPSLASEIANSQLDALIVHGHTPAANLIGIAAAKAMKIPVFIRGETHLGLSRGSIKSLVRRPLLSTFYNALDGALAIGSANAEFYKFMRVPDERIFSMPYVIDNARFQSAANVDRREPNPVRSKLCKNPEVPVVLFAAKYQHRKGAADLINACAMLVNEGAQFHLALVGSGEQAAALERLKTVLGLDNVSFHGFINQAEMPQIYAASDIFVLPSIDEPWGLAVNEAMCAGIPVVVSQEVGCARDLVRDGVNGRTFRGGDVDGLAQALRPLIMSQALRQAMGHESRRIISNWGFEQCRQGLLDAMTSVKRRARA